MGLVQWLQPVARLLLLMWSGLPLMACQVNDVAAVESVAYLIKFDSVHGTWAPNVEAEGGQLVITQGERKVVVGYTGTRDPAQVRAAPSVRSSHVTGAIYWTSDTCCSTIAGVSLMQ
jgi:hypothetical protein